MKVFDCFLFFNELDLLEIRLNLLFPYVDYFVIVESEITFQGKKKNFLFEQNQSKFERFKEKIVYFKIAEYLIDFENPPHIDQPSNEDEVLLSRIYKFIKESNNFSKNQYWWGNDFFQRESIARALATMHPSDNDIILLSDADEIISVEALKKIKTEFCPDYIYTCKQNEFYYYLNYYNNSDWMGTCAFNYGVYKKSSMNQIRAFRTGAFSNIKTIFIENAGWHFTNLGNINGIKEKIKSWSHKEFNNKVILYTINYNVKYGYDVFRRNFFKRLKYLNPDDVLLNSLLMTNTNSYLHLIGPQIKKEPMIQRVFISYLIKIALKLSRIFQ